jgi:hypothetical protein
MGCSNNFSGTYWAIFSPKLRGPSGLSRYRYIKTILQVTKQFKSVRDSQDYKAVNFKSI